MIIDEPGEGIASITSNKPAYEVGEEFLITVVTEDGYELDELTIVDDQDNEIELTKVSEEELPEGGIEYKYSGVMPEGTEFLQAAGRAGKGSDNYLTFRSSQNDTNIPVLSCVGEIIVESIKNGQNISATYNNLQSTEVSVQSDKNTDITIKGVVTELEFDSETFVNYIDITHAKSLQGLSLYFQEDLEELVTKDNTELTLLNIEGCSSLRLLDISQCRALETLYVQSNADITTIKYPATNSDVSNAIAQVITDADAEDGTVYTDSEGAYYSTIETAANNKGWTIEQL